MQFDSTDLRDYKNSKAYSYKKSRWLQPLCFHKLSGSKYCIFKGACWQPQRINKINRGLLLIRPCHCTCMAGMDQSL